MVTGRTAGSPDCTAQFGRLQLANFINPSGLLRIHGAYQETSHSGNAVISSPGESGFGSLRQALIERSNVEVVHELVELEQTRAHYDLVKQMLLGR